MKALAIAPSYSCAEENVSTPVKAEKVSSKTERFEWHRYLKQDREHTIALSMFNK